MQLIIKEFEEKETEPLKLLLSLCHEEEDFIDVVNGNNLNFAYSALFEEKLVSIMFAWTSSYHPYCTYFRILCNPFYKRLNLEKKLLLSLEESHIENKPLQTSLWETSASLIHIYKNSGFNEIRRTYMPKLKTVEVAEYAPHNSEKYKLKTLADILSDESVMNKLIHLVKSNYEKTHLVNPIIEMEIKKWEKMILASDTLLKGSYIYLDKDEQNIIAYSFLNETDSVESYELGWCGASNIERKRLIPDLIIHQAKYALEHGVQFISGEFDTTDEFSMEVLNNFPFEPCPTWITYQKE